MAESADAASAFPLARSNMEWSLEIRERNLAAEKKLLAEWTAKRDSMQHMVDQFQASVEKIETEVSQMRDELERLS